LNFVTVFGMLLLTKLNETGAEPCLSLCGSQASSERRHRSACGREPIARAQCMRTGADRTSYARDTDDSSNRVTPRGGAHRGWHAAGAHPIFFFPIFQPPSQSTTRSCATTATCLGATTTTVALFYSKSYFERNFCR
jgi:hypothetical protein